MSLTVVGYGLIAIGLALMSMQLGGTATQINLSFFGASGGPLLGMYLLGCLFPCANWIVSVENHFVNKGSV